MNKSIAIAALAFATTTQAAEFPIPHPSAVNLSHEFAELAGLGIDLTACTADHHTVTVHGAIFFDKTVMSKKPFSRLPVDRFRGTMQSAFVASMKTVNDAQYGIELLTTTGFADADKALTDAQYKLRTEVGVPMVIIPRTTNLNREGQCNP
jgi:hypothetical protein